MKVNNPNYLNGLTVSAEQINAVVEGGGAGLTPEQTEALGKIEGLKASASEIDNIIGVGKTTDFLNKARGSSKIAIVGDSITHGYGADTNNDVYSQRLAQSLRQVTHTNNIGFVTAWADYASYDIFHKVSFLNKSNWTIKSIDSESINGCSYGTSTASEEISYFSEISGQNKFKIHYKKQLTPLSFEVYVNNALVSTISEASNASVIENETAYISMSSTSYNTIKIKLISGTLEIAGITYIEDETDAQIDILATGGRRTSYPSTNVISKIGNNYDVIIWALGYNDTTSYDDYHKNRSTDRLNQLFDLIVLNNTYFVFIDFIWDILTPTDYYSTLISSFLETYPNGYYLNIKDEIKKTDGTKADSDYRINTLKEWKDIPHPNSSGYERIFKSIKFNLLANEEDVFKEAINIEKINTSTSYGNNEINSTSINSFVYGEGNKLVGSNTLIFGKSNEGLSDSSISGFGNIATVANVFLSGFKNTISKQYSAGLGVRGIFKNFGFGFGSSRTDTKINQYSHSIRNVKTTNATESYLRDFDNSAFIQTEPNSIIVLKGVIIVTKDGGASSDEFEIDAKLINTGGTVVLITDSNFPTDGITKTKGSNLITAKVYGGTSNQFTIRVVGESGVTYRWLAKYETIEQSSDYSY